MIVESFLCLSAEEFLRDDPLRSGGSLQRRRSELGGLWSSLGAADALLGCAEEERCRFIRLFNNTFWKGLLRQLLPRVAKYSLEKWVRY